MNGSVLPFHAPDLSGECAKSLIEQQPQSSTTLLAWTAGQETKQETANYSPRNRILERAARGE